MYLYISTYVSIYYVSIYYVSVYLKKVDKLVLRWTSLARFKSAYLYLHIYHILCIYLYLYMYLYIMYLSISTYVSIYYVSIYLKKVDELVLQWTSLARFRSGYLYLHIYHILFIYIYLHMYLYIIYLYKICGIELGLYSLK